MSRPKSKYLIKENLPTILKSLAVDCEIDVETLKYCLERYAREGISFLTKTLPQLSKAVVSSLEEGVFLRPTAFAWKGRSLLVFRSLLCQIFLPSGKLRSDASARAIKLLRQFCEYFYKLTIDPSGVELENAAQSYLDHEKRLETEPGPSSEWVDKLRKNFETHYNYISRLTLDDILGSNRPRGTSGSFFNSQDCRDLQGTKIPWALFKHLRAGESNPNVPFGFSGQAGLFLAYPSSSEGLYYQQRPERTCQVMFVPKDSRAPRVISKEPLLLVKAQMSYFDTVSRKLEIGTSNRINFTKQSVNQELARTGSVDKRNGTVDLRDASDSVLYSLVKGVFRNSPGMYACITRLRSTHAIVPTQNGDVKVELRKLAGMGSGLTFPTMALLIHLSVTTRISQRTGIPFQDASKMVYVYGDDLIVPRKYYEYALEGLSLSALKVNANKSFVRGFFRESCGADYFKGEDVGITRLRISSGNIGTVKELNRRGVIRFTDHALMQLERHCRELVDNGLLVTAHAYYKRIARAVGNLPYVSRTSPVIGRYDKGRFVTDIAEKAMVPVSVRVDFSTGMDPYKYLGRVLRPSEPLQFTTIDELVDDQVTPFGVVTQPRKVRLVKRVVSVLKV